MVDLRKHVEKELELERKLDTLTEEFKDLKRNVLEALANMEALRNITSATAALAANPYPQTMQSAMFSPMQTISPTINPFLVTACCCDSERRGKR